MNPKRIRIISIAIAVGVAAALILLSFFHRDVAKLSGAILPDAVSLPYPTGAYYHQTKNNCGPYSAAAAVRLLEKSDAVSSEDVVSRIPLRVPGYFTMPQGLGMFLRHRDYAVRMNDTSRLSEDDRIQFLRERLSDGDAAIVLVGRSVMTQHYMLILGYDRLRDSFHVYNPALADGGAGLTVDLNGAEVGNVTMGSADLLKYWSGGGVLGVYRWFVLTAGVK